MGECYCERLRVPLHLPCFSKATIYSAAEVLAPFFCMPMPLMASLRIQRQQPLVESAEVTSSEQNTMQPWIAAKQGARKLD
jgi:hypothetical protein